jgi:phosphotriesterase-related protein
MTLGACSAHSLVNITESVRRAAAFPDAGLEPGEAGPGIAASWAKKWNQPICLENRADVERHWFYYGNYKINDLDDVIHEAKLFKRHGGGCLVDQTSIGLARDPKGLQQVSREAGLHIVMATSWYTHEYHNEEVKTFDIGRLRDRILRDLEVGVANGVRAGIIGEVGLNWPMHPDEEKVLRASIQAQKLTGAPLSVHTGFGPDAYWRVVKIIEEEGGDLSRTIMCHVEHRLPTRSAPDSFDPAPFIELARTGVYMELDCFGWEGSYRQRGKVDMPNDAVRLNYLTALADAGFESKLLISHDIALQHWQRKHGGHGWQHIPETVTQLMRYKGFDEALIEKILYRNPQAMLTIA